MRLKDDCLIVLEIDEQLAVEHEEELVGVVVLVPMKVTLDYAKPDDGIIDRCQGLVKPRLVGRRFGSEVDVGKLPELVVKMDVVVIVGHWEEALLNQYIVA